jgi:hypothetical protein
MHEDSRAQLSASLLGASDGLRDPFEITITISQKKDESSEGDKSQRNYPGN